LVTEPDVLLLDEPFSALDAHLRSELTKQLITTLSHYQGIALFVSHNLEEAYRICQKLLVIDRGRVAAAGDRQAILDRPGTLTVSQLTGCKNHSRLQPMDRYRVFALDWNCVLQNADSVSSCHTHIGIRAHQIAFLDTPNQPNTFAAWVAWTSETPHRMTIYLKLGDPPMDADDYHLQAEVFKEKWERLRDRPTPWFLYLNSERLMLLQS
jgi:molybdate transport system permease protein